MFRTSKSARFIKIILPTFLTLVLFVLVFFLVLIPYYQEAIMDGKREMLKELTISTINTMDRYYKLQQTGKITEFEAKKMAIEHIYHLRYGEANKDYFWITDSNTKMIMHPYRPELNGKDAAIIQDAVGKYFFKEYTLIVKKYGYGYIDYMWQWKDDSTQIVPKLSFVKEFQPWGWIVGTGVYINDVTEETTKFTKYIVNIAFLIIFSVSILLLIIILQSIKLEKQRIKAIEKMKISENNLKELNASKDKLFSIIAHDLKNPFNTILGFSELLLQDIKNNRLEQIEAMIEFIRTQTKDTLNLLEQLLKWAKIQTGQTIFKPEEIDLSSIVSMTVENLKLIAETKQIELNYHQDKEIKTFVDYNMFIFILRNLITNSIKFTNIGGNITVETNILKDEVEVSVIDNGIGMDKNTIGRLFNLQEKVSKVGTANEKGTGLGLIICKEFIDKHNGKIKVESQLGKGSKFTFSIPMNEKPNPVK